MVIVPRVMFPRFRNSLLFLIKENQRTQKQSWNFATLHMRNSPFQLCFTIRRPNTFFFFFFKFFFLQLLYLFISLFLAVLGLRFVRGLSLVTASGGHSSPRCRDRSSSRCAGLSPSRPLPPRGTGSRRAGSVVVAHGPSRSAACGILPDQGSNPCPPHQQADSQPLRHQGSPRPNTFYINR